MTKKFVSITLILVVVFSLFGAAFADTYNGETDAKGGQFILEDKVVQDYIAPVEGVEEVLEIVEWSAKYIKNDLPNGVIKGKVKVEEMNYEIEIKFGNIVLGKAEGTLSNTEGEQIIDVDYKSLGIDKKAKFIFEVTKTIKQEYVAPVEEVKEENGLIKTYVVGYEYVEGKYEGRKVIFFKEDIVRSTQEFKIVDGLKVMIGKAKITNDFKRLRRMNFIPDTSKKWSGWCPGYRVWLYYIKNWNIIIEPTPTPTESEPVETTPVETTGEVSTTSSTSTSTEVTPSTSTTPSTEVSKEPVPTPTTSTIISNADILPKTGEESKTPIVIAGFIITLIGIAGYFIIRKTLKQN